MKTKIKPLIIVIVLAAAAGGIWFLKSGTHAGAEAAVYYCPMHPTYTSNRPGNCPICNMKLVKRESTGTEAGKSTPPEHAGHENHDQGGAVVPRTMTMKELMSLKPGEICLLHKCKMGKCMIAMTEDIARLGKCPHCGENLGVTIVDAVPGGYSQIRLTPENQEAIGVKTEEVKKMTMTKVIRTVGRIAYDPALYQAEEEYLQAVSARAKAANAAPEIQEQSARLADSAKIKLRLLGLSDELIAEVETSGKADRSLLYPEAGGNVWLYAPIYEYELPYVKAGDKIDVQVPAVSGKTFTGVIRAIDPVLDPVTRSARVRAVLENRDGVMKPEMYVNASINVSLGEKLAVPEEAVFSTGDKNIVFVAKPGGSFEPREVVLGAATDHYREAVSGVGEGEKVVTSGNFLIDSESRLKAALEGIGGSGGTAGGHQHGA